MNRIAVIVAALLAASPLAAQDELIPTHVSDMGKISASIRLRYEAGTGTYSQAGSTDYDVNLKNGFGILEASVGLGMGFEAEATLPYQFSGTTKADASGTEFEQVTVGMGDLELRGNYRFTDGNLALPQIMGGIIISVPAGSSDVGQFEQKVGGVVVTKGEDAGPGDGVLKAGAQVGASKRLAGAEIYGLVRGVVATAKNKDSGTEVEIPDKVSLILGANIGVGMGATIDVRATTDYSTKRVKDDGSGTTTTEDPNTRILLQADLYYSLGGMVTLIAGVSAGWIQDHAFDKESGVDQDQIINYGVELGVQVSLP